MKRMIFITDSMTSSELDSDGSPFMESGKDGKPIGLTSRVTRVARGSGTSVREVEELLCQYRMMANMAKQAGGKNGWLQAAQKMQQAAGGRGRGANGMPSPAQIQAMQVRRGFVVSYVVDAHKYVACDATGYAPADAAGHAWRRWHAGDDECHDARSRRRPSRYGGDATYVIVHPSQRLAYNPVCVGMMSQMGGGLGGLGGLGGGMPNMGDMFKMMGMGGAGR